MIAVATGTPWAPVVQRDGRIAFIVERSDSQSELWVTGNDQTVVKVALNTQIVGPLTAVSAIGTGTAAKLLLRGMYGDRQILAYVDVSTGSVIILPFDSAMSTLPRTSLADGTWPVEHAALGFESTGVDISTIDKDGKMVSSIVQDDGDQTMPSVSPDHLSIAFLSE